MSYTRRQFCIDLLKGLGNTNPSTGTLNFVIGWSVEESGHDLSRMATYNLWNTTQRMTGSTTFNSVGVQNYASYIDGVNANVKTLNNGLYPSLINALRFNDTASLGMSGGGVSSGVAGDLSVWVSGQRNPINTSYISAILNASQGASQWGNELAPGNAAGITTGPAQQPAQTVDQIFTQKGLWKWYSSHITWGYNGGNELGNDYATTWGTPVATPVSGTVASITHHNNSVSDVIDIVDAKGGTWEYLHQTSKVTTGQKVNVGDVIGLENGLPVDQYSTGPHIEVRYKPAGATSWPNPSAVFASIGSSQGIAGSSSTNPILNALIGVTTNLDIQTVSSQAANIVNTVPGFLGICEALDKVEQFIPFQLPTQAQADANTTAQNTDITIWNWDIGVPNPFSVAQAATAAASLPADGIQAILVFTTTNFLAFAVRTMFVLAGVILFIALAINLVSSFTNPKEIMGAAESLGMLAAA